MQKICKICLKSFSTIRSYCSSCNTKLRRYRAKDAAVKLLGGQCRQCGWKGPLAGFEFHHPKKNKSFNIAQAANKSWIKIKKELKKCILLCANCHRINHSDHLNPRLIKAANEYTGALFL